MENKIIIEDFDDVHWALFQQAWNSAECWEYDSYCVRVGRLLIDEENVQYQKRKVRCAKSFVPKSVGTLGDKFSIFLGNENTNTLK